MSQANLCCPYNQPCPPELPSATGDCPWGQLRSIAACRAQEEDDSANGITETLANRNKSSPSVLHQSNLALKKSVFFFNPPVRKRFTAVRIAHPDSSLTAEDIPPPTLFLLQVHLCHHLALEVPGRIHHPASAPAAPTNE